MPKHHHKRRVSFSAIAHKLNVCGHMSIWTYFSCCSMWNWCPKFVSTFQLQSKYIKEFLNGEWKLWNDEVSSYHANKLLSVTMLHECMLHSKSRTSEEFLFQSVMSTLWAVIIYFCGHLNHSYYFLLNLAYVMEIWKVNFLFKTWP
jgi:hypothetical protein